MSKLAGEARAHVERRKGAESYAGQVAALQILCGIDIEKAASEGPGAREAALSRIDRALRRERLKGAQRHWSYDLNRHIALKQARNRLAAMNNDVAARPAAEAPTTTGSSGAFSARSVRERRTTAGRSRGEG